MVKKIGIIDRNEWYYSSFLFSKQLQNQLFSFHPLKKEKKNKMALNQFCMHVSKFFFYN